MDIDTSESLDRIIQVAFELWPGGLPVVSRGLFCDDHTIPLSFYECMFYIPFLGVFIDFLIILKVSFFVPIL